MKNELVYFQDLPDEMKEKVFENIKESLIEDKTITEEDVKNGWDMEKTDDWINCNNTPGWWKEWI